MITQEVKAELVKKFGKDEKDSGNAAVQVALLTERINGLASHFEVHKHDNHGKTGLMKMIGQRRRLLRYVNKRNNEEYKNLIKELGLRK